MENYLGIEFGSAGMEPEFACAFSCLVKHHHRQERYAAGAAGQALFA